MAQTILRFTIVLIWIRISLLNLLRVVEMSLTWVSVKG